MLEVSLFIGDIVPNLYLSSFYKKFIIRKINIEN